MKAEGSAVVQAFLCEALPGVEEENRLLAADLIKTTLSCVGKQFPESPRTPAEIAAWSDAMADRLCAYLERLQTMAVKAPASGGSPRRSGSTR